MLKMSEYSKEQMSKDFGFNDSELIEIEEFINRHENKSVKEILDELFKNENLNNKQKIMISYIIGNSARDMALRQEHKKFGTYLPPIPLSAG